MMNIKKLSIIVAATLLVACSSTSDAPKQTGANQQLVEVQTGRTENVQAKQAFEEAVSKLSTIKFDELKKGSPELQPAEVALEKAISYDDKFGKAWFNLGVIREKLGKVNEAKEAYKKAYEVAPGLAGPYVNLGTIEFEETGDLEKSKEYFEKAIGVDQFNSPANNNISAYYRIKRDYPKAVSHARQSLAGNSQNVDAYANLARAYYEYGKYDVALLVCLNAFKIEKKRPDIHNIVGLVWLKKHDVTEAIRQFRGAIEVDPTYVPALMNLAAVMLNVRNYEKAIELFGKVVELEPNNLEAKISLAAAHRSKGDSEIAQKMYDEVSAIDPKNAWIAYNQGILEQDLYAQNALRGIGGDPAPEDPVAMMDWQIENMKKAIQHYKNAIGHYNDYLAWEREDRIEARNEAKQRINNVTEVIRINQEQIPALEASREELKEDLRLAAQEAAANGGDQAGDGQEEAAPEQEDENNAG